MQNGGRQKTTSWLRYALGMLGYSIPGYMYTSQGTYFYNDKMGLSLAMIALGNIFYVVWDAINDPLCGFLSDRTRTRFGRRKPWMLIGAPLFALFMVLFFNPPAGAAGAADVAGAAGANMLLIYFTVLLMLTETANTIITTNYHALLPELFTSVEARTRANGMRQVFSLAGMIAGVVLVPMFVQALGYRAVALILAIVGAAIFVFSALGAHENPDFQQAEQPKLLDSLKAVGKNRNFWAAGATNFFYQAANGLILAVIPFYIKYALSLPDSNATFLTGAVFVTAIPAVFAWSMAARRLGVVRTWRAALVVLAASFVPMLFISSLVPAVACGIAIGIGLGGVIANLDLVNAAIIDEDARASGLRREGIYQSAISFITRFSGLMRSLVFFLVAAIFGFGGSDSPGPAPDMAARSMLSIFPLALMLLAVACSLFVHPKTMERASGVD
ncbi:MAG: MFS transporter [Clostridiales bacterium]|jgi:GPH family glycoside/pentoside/hexuronide:cation symporter|nr:MFS transporter [Clostridiales bacterium]